MEMKDKLVALRKSSNLTQKDLGLRLHVSDKTVSKWERGRSIPDSMTLKKLSEVFEVNIDYFFSEDSMKKDIEKYSYNKCMYIAMGLLIPLGLFPLVVILVMSIGMSDIKELFLIVSFIIALLATLISFGIAAYKYYEVINNKKYEYPKSAYNLLLIYIIMFETALIIFHFLFNNYPLMLILNTFSFGLILSLVYYIYSKNLKFIKGKLLLALKIIFGITILLYIITPRASIAPWTKSQAQYVVLIIGVILLTRVSQNNSTQMD